MPGEENTPALIFLQSPPNAPARRRRVHIVLATLPPGLPWAHPHRAPYADSAGYAFTDTNPGHSKTDPNSQDNCDHLE